MSSSFGFRKNLILRVEACKKLLGPALFYFFLFLSGLGLDRKMKIVKVLTSLKQL
jgi:hypothetical protein